jgi:hypothetical protein
MWYGIPDALFWPHNYSVVFFVIFSGRTEIPPRGEYCSLGGISVRPEGKAEVMGAQKCGYVRRELSA